MADMTRLLCLSAAFLCLGFVTGFSIRHRSERSTDLAEALEILQRQRRRVGARDFLASERLLQQQQEEEGEQPLTLDDVADWLRHADRRNDVIGDNEDPWTSGGRLPSYRDEEVGDNDFVDLGDDRSDNAGSDSYYAASIGANLQRQQKQQQLLQQYPQQRVSDSAVPRRFKVSDNELKDIFDDSSNNDKDSDNDSKSDDTFSYSKRNQQSKGDSKVDLHKKVKEQAILSQGDRRIQQRNVNNNNNNNDNIEYVSQPTKLPSVDSIDTLMGDNDNTDIIDPRLVSTSSNDNKNKNDVNDNEDDVLNSLSPEEVRVLMKAVGKLQHRADLMDINNNHNNNYKVDKKSSDLEQIASVLNLNNNGNDDNEDTSDNNLLMEPNSYKSSSQSSSSSFSSAFSNGEGGDLVMSEPVTQEELKSVFSETNGPITKETVLVGSKGPEDEEPQIVGEEIVSEKQPDDSTTVISERELSDILPKVIEDEMEVEREERVIEEQEEKENDQGKEIKEDEEEDKEVEEEGDEVEKAEKEIAKEVENLVEDNIERANLENVIEDDNLALETAEEAVAKEIAKIEKESLSPELVSRYLQMNKDKLLYKNQLTNNNNNNNNDIITSSKRTAKRASGMFANNLDESNYLQQQDNLKRLENYYSGETAKHSAQIQQQQLQQQQNNKNDFVKNNNNNILGEQSASIQLSDRDTSALIQAFVAKIVTLQREIDGLRFKSSLEDLENDQLTDALNQATLGQKEGSVSPDEWKSLQRAIDIERALQDLKSKDVSDIDQPLPLTSITSPQKQFGLNDDVIQDNNDVTALDNNINNSGEYTEVEEGDDEEDDVNAAADDVDMQRLDNTLFDSLDLENDNNINDNINYNTMDTISIGDDDRDNRNGEMMGKRGQPWKRQPLEDREKAYDIYADSSPYSGMIASRSTSHDGPTPEDEEYANLLKATYNLLSREDQEGESERMMDELEGGRGDDADESMERDGSIASLFLPNAEMCPAVQLYSTNCDLADEYNLPVDFEARALCNLHQMCYTCGHSLSVTQPQCDLVYRAAVSSLCKAKESCMLESEMFLRTMKLKTRYLDNVQPTCRERCTAEFMGMF